MGADRALPASSELVAKAVREVDEAYQHHRGKKTKFNDELVCLCRDYKVISTVMHHQQQSQQLCNHAGVEDISSERPETSI